MPSPLPFVPVPDPQKHLADQDVLVLLACLLWGETRNQVYEAKLGVGAVVRNRMRLNRYYMGGATWKGVILQPWQFSCFNRSDVNSSKLLNPLKFDSLNTWKDCYEAAKAVYLLSAKDLTNGAIFYFSKPLTTPPRVWGLVEFTTTIGDLHFYRETSPVIERHAA